VSGFLDRVFGSSGNAAASVSYDESKVLAADHDGDHRRALAARDDVKPEVLYYLAADELSSVRRQIAANEKTPRQADRLLAEDVDDEVRCDLARKIGRIAPGLSQDAQEQIQELTFEILDILAHDQLPQVRQIIAEEIKQSDSVPRAIIQHLARDLELIVAAPVLEYSPLLSDEDLIEIIESDSVQGALSAISRRASVEAPVADAIAYCDDRDAIAALLANPSAQIREDTLDMLLDQAPEIESWHQPLVERPELSLRAVRRIGKFVAMALLRLLEERNDLPEGATDEVRRAVTQRIDEAGVNGGVDAGLDAKKAFDEGKLNDEAIQSAIDLGNHDFVTNALALMNGLAPAAVEHVLGLQGAKSITALVWRAGLSMRTAMQVQLKVARVPPMDVLNAKDGTDYPMTPEELQWHADMFTG
jgi:uncharacterized protein (DUF2336 family)